ncbi:hypothetical protein MH117_22230 [Paenibacillus sp. ACRRX]|uniref:hypothetical protein n=1 Tax=Paenibacillus sp. ACRRX TaxID=2918206 RepID=UPI001EF6BF9C|nr:hypothetical protein [Paenibacillus sp. ACRRX]MCG7410136.1 hypothetical protein [Paenibacillus sp. ACRRX]
MKEAIKVNIDGFYVEPTLVTDSVTGVFPVMGSEAASSEQQMLTGHIVAVEVPAGLYKPRWDFKLAVWMEGMQQEEINAIQNNAATITDTEVIGRELVQLKLKAIQQQNEIQALKQELIQVKHG